MPPPPLPRRYFPYELEDDHKLVREIGNVTSGLEITFQFAVKSKYMNGKMAIAAFIKSTTARWHQHTRNLKVQ